MSSDSALHTFIDGLKVTKSRLCTACSLCAREVSVVNCFAPPSHPAGSIAMSVSVFLSVSSQEGFSLMAAKLYVPRVSAGSTSSYSASME